MENVIGQVRFDETGDAHQLIHYAYPTGKTLFRGGQRVPQIGVACRSGLEAHGWQQSNDVEAITCPGCIRTAMFQDVLAKVKPLRGKRWKGMA